MRSTLVFLVVISIAIFTLTSLSTPRPEVRRPLPIMTFILDETDFFDALESYATALCDIDNYDVVNEGEK